MSFSGNDRKVRAGGGSSFPLNPAADTEATFAAIIADALRRDFGDTPAHVKHLARLTGVNARTAQNWLQARNGPSGAGLVVLMRHSDEVTFAVLRLADRNESRAAAELVKSSARLRDTAKRLIELLPEE